MKEYFDKAVTVLEQQPMEQSHVFYSLGFIHGLSSCGFLSDDESSELVKMLEYKRGVLNNANI